MKPRTRRMRAIIRDRRRGWSGIVPLIGPLTGYDLYLLNRYYFGTGDDHKTDVVFPWEEREPFAVLDMWKSDHR